MFLLKHKPKTGWADSKPRLPVTRSKAVCQCVQVLALSASYIYIYIYKLQHLNWTGQLADLVAFIPLDCPKFPSSGNGGGLILPALAVFQFPRFSKVLLMMMLINNKRTNKTKS